RLLEPEELETLHLFVASPIFQERYHADDTLRFFEEVKRFYPDFQDASLQKEKMADLLFAGRKNPGFDVTRAMADLMRITRHFINFRYSAVQSSRPRKNKSGLEDQPDAEQILNRSRQQLALMRFYNERLHDRPTLFKKRKQVPGKKVRHADNFFENLYTGLGEELDQIQDFSAFEQQEFNEFLYFRYLVQHEKSEFDGRIDPFNNDLNLVAAIEELDAFYLFNKLHLLSRFINLEQHINLSEAQPKAYQRIVENKKLMLHICRLIVKTEPI
ncbi:MAG: hypothetical protein ABIQ93_12095, partial [Saprospiraceae bacterium]